MEITIKITKPFFYQWAHLAEVSNGSRTCEILAEIDENGNYEEEYVLEAFNRILNRG